MIVTQNEYAEIEPSHRWGLSLIETSLETQEVSQAKTNEVKNLRKILLLQQKEMDHTEINLLEKINETSRLHEEILMLPNEYEQVTTSTSWKFTRPLRSVGRYLR